MNDPRRLLIRGVNWLGDAVMTTPALRRLRERFPTTHITLLSAAKIADLFSGHPDIDAVLRFDPKAGLWATSRLLRSQAFDTALILPNSPRSALECWLARIPARIGVTRALRSWSLTRAVPERPGRVPMIKPSPRDIAEALRHPKPVAERRPPLSAHHTLDYLHLAAALGARPDPAPPRLAVTYQEVAQARTRFHLHDHQTWAAINPGAEYGPAKRWPAERFAEVAHRVRDAGVDVRWVILGGPRDVPIAESIRQAVPESVSVAGQTSLRELMAVLKIARVVVTNDTGPMHVAAALNTPVVVPFGSTSPEMTGPGLPGDPRHHLLQSDAPCSPCFLRECPIDFRCMLGIQPDRVAAATLAALRDTPH